MDLARMERPARRETKKLITDSHERAFLFFRADVYCRDNCIFVMACPNLERSGRYASRVASVIRSRHYPLIRRSQSGAITHVCAYTVYCIYIYISTNQSGMLIYKSFEIQEKKNPSRRSGKLLGKFASNCCVWLFGGISVTKESLLLITRFWKLSSTIGSASLIWRRRYWNAGYVTRTSRSARIKLYHLPIVSS